MVDQVPDSGTDFSPLTIDVYKRQSFCISTGNNWLMKQLSSIWIFIVAMAMTLSSCDLVGGIFKAGFYAAIILVILVVVIVIWLVRRMRR